ncbi:uncharacterized protein LOC131682406 [Topomyia yanbarensis]|uniref:uncharacterized protein LOC131682406 n=1 Tax=Topomyia yanbarensis TaxID=2498891 RepID=UPI00273ADAF9|nr:uncharacterized protein LOC131682406 [Topomyia yanbarensis]
MTHRVHPHVPKQKKFTPTSLAAVDPLPVVTVDETQTKFVGIFTGLTVEVCDPEAIAKLSLGGCFGQGTISRSFPASVRNCGLAEVPLQLARQRQIDRRHEWKRKYGPSAADNGKTYVRVMDEHVEMQLNDGILQARELKDDLVEVTRDPYPMRENLSLLFEETMFLVEKLKCLEVRTLDGIPLPQDQLLKKIVTLKKDFITSYVSYVYFKSKNWIIRSGLKFGGDFLLYQKGPQFFHASFIVLLIPYQNGQKLPGCAHCLDNHDFQCFNRIAETTGKELLVLEVHYPVDLNPMDYVNCATRLNEFKVCEIFPKHHNYAAVRGSHQQSSSNRK